MYGSYGSLMESNYNLNPPDVIRNGCCDANRKIIVQLEKENYDLRQRIKRDKRFLYMVIHDLKHPIDCQIGSLKQMMTFFEDYLKKSERVIDSFD